MKEVYYRGIRYTNYTTTPSSIGLIYNLAPDLQVLERDLDIRTIVSLILDKYYVSATPEVHHQIKG